MDFLEAFEKVDTDFSGSITQEELQIFMKNNGYDDKFVKKWLNLFDSNGDGTISIDEYCEILGLVPDDSYLERVNSARMNAAKKSTNDMLVIHDTDIITTNAASRTDNDNDEDELTITDYMNDVRTILVSDEMQLDVKQLIARLALEAQAKCPDEFEMAKYIKQSLDDKIEPHWHVIVCRFNHASFVGHEVGCLFHFFLLRYSFFVWKTPYY